MNAYLILMFCLHCAGVVAWLRHNPDKPDRQLGHKGAAGMIVLMTLLACWNAYIQWGAK